MKKIWAWLTDKNWKTWIGHLIQGCLIYLFVYWSVRGWFVEAKDWDPALASEAAEMAGGMSVLFAFLHREVSDLIAAVVKDGRRGFADKIEDSWWDFVFPLIGVGLVVGIVNLIG